MPFVNDKENYIINMGFFQNSVINKHLKALDKAVVNTAYAKFKKYFHNPEIQQNIREAKEEQFQEGFLRELFVKVLGYTLNPQPNYNLTTELKNEKGAKKADGAILKEGKALAVIELKGTDTKDLDKINTQAFNYKNNQTDCIYVITSNFEKLRFFIHNSVDHIEFNLFTLTEQEFELLWLCLNVDCLLGGIPLKVKEESLLAEENVTKQLYKDYATFRIDLWQNMVKNRPDADQLLLFKKTQKLLDRFLFIFFAEDSGLLPPNSISKIVKRWNVLQEEDAYKPLYDIFNQYFGYINTGRKGKTPQDDIFAYNGGLFFSDEVLDNIVIDDEVLQPHVMKLTSYDFQSEIDVNILGHIFENSLSEIENVIAKLEGKEVDKNKTKRKKEGVFYTPKYITKYIVDNTVGKLCQEKKAELGIVDEEYTKGRRNRKKETIKKLDISLQAYRKWLLKITICDPACGSGAFLNQALEFLIAEHAYIDELQAHLLGRSIVFQDVSNHILERNIYGVDINEESIEIAKLSLWLRTAQKGRKLTSLNNNLKCGNSLIDDPEVVEEKAFNWHKEFPEIFEKYGFDVVIGNPPWGAEISSDEKNELKQTLNTNKSLDSSEYFILKSLSLLKNKGYFSFIVPKSIIFANNWLVSRNSILNNKIVALGDVGIAFKDVILDSSIFSIKKENERNNEVRISRFKPLKRFQEIKEQIDLHSIDQKIMIESKSLILAKISKDTEEIIKKVQAKKSFLENYKKEIFRGVYIPDKIKEDCLDKGDKLFVNKVPDVSMYNIIKIRNLDITFLNKKIKQAISKVGRDRIIIKVLRGNRLTATFADKDLITTEKLVNLIVDEKQLDLLYLLSLLNSKLVSFYMAKTVFSDITEISRVMDECYTRRIPIIPLNLSEQKLFNNLVTKILNQNKVIKEKKRISFLWFQDVLKVKVISNKLTNLEKLEREDYCQELAKQKVNMNNMDIYNSCTKIFNEIKSLHEKNQNLMKKIDLMIYDLYGLDSREIGIIESYYD